MVLSKNGNELEELMGRKKLSEYAKLFDLMLLMESFLTQTKLSKWQLMQQKILFPNISKISVPA